MDGVVLDDVIDDKVKQICYGKYMVKQICLVKQICYTNMSATRNIQVSRHLFFIGLFSINLQKKYVNLEVLHLQQYSPNNNHYSVS